MDPTTNPFPFGDIEQDNNPSFYGNPSMLNNPYGSRMVDNTLDDETDEDDHTIVHDSSNIPNGNGETTTTSNHHKRKESNSKNSPNLNGFLDINDSLVMSTQIAKMLNLKLKVTIEVSNTERLMNSSVMVYCIQLNDETTTDPPVIVKRRYSEFKSLRDNLIRLFPTLIVAPIPRKHTLLNYLISSLNTGEELLIVLTRKRLFTLFLNDLIFNSDERIRMCPLLHKFLDPSYEQNWDNAIYEPPASLVPNHILLANPIDPTNQNGLYSLLPNVSSNIDHPNSGGSAFSFMNNGSGGGSDGMGSLKSFNDDLTKLKEQIHIIELKQRRRENGDTESGNPSLNEELMMFKTNNFLEIPTNLIEFETKFHQTLKVTSDLDILNSRANRNLKQMIHMLMDLGSNLNNFSLQVHSNNSGNGHDGDVEYRNNSYNNEFNPTTNHEHMMRGEMQLSSQIEKFGSTIDLIFLNYESYLNVCFLPKWQEIIHQLIQYYLTALQVIRFYKLKLVQYKILYRAKYKKSQELESIHQNFDSHQSIDEALKLGLDLNSPSITQAVKSFERKKNRQLEIKMGKKKSWYGIFGGKANGNSGRGTNNGWDYQSDIVNSNNNAGSKDEVTGQYLHKFDQLDKEIEKLDQLVELTNEDMVALTKELNLNFEDFTNQLEKKWLQVMLDFIRGGRKLFEENIAAWQKMRYSIDY